MFKPPPSQHHMVQRCVCNVANACRACDAWHSPSPLGLLSGQSTTGHRAQAGPLQGSFLQPFKLAKVLEDNIMKVATAEK